MHRLPLQVCGSGQRFLFISGLHTLSTCISLSVLSDLHSIPATGFSLGSSDSAILFFPLRWCHVHLGSSKCFTISSFSSTWRLSSSKLYLALPTELFKHVWNAEWTHFHTGKVIHVKKEQNLTSEGNAWWSQGRWFIFETCFVYASIAEVTWPQPNAFANTFLCNKSSRRKHEGCICSSCSLICQLYLSDAYVQNMHHSINSQITSKSIYAKIQIPSLTELAFYWNSNVDTM